MKFHEDALPLSFRVKIGGSTFRNCFTETQPFPISTHLYSQSNLAFHKRIMLARI